MRFSIGNLVCTFVSDIKSCEVVSHREKRDNNFSPMAVNNNTKIPLACPHYTISSLLLITAVVMFIGTFAIKYELSTLFGNYLENYLEAPLLILITGSVLVFADACLGLISLAHRWHHGIITFFACTLCLLVAMIVLVALAYLHLNTETEAMYSRLERDLKNHEISLDTVDTVQLRLKCCGYKNVSDWTKETIKNIPQSCCAVKSPCDTNNSWEIHSTGCYEAMSLLLDYRKWIVVVVLAVLALVEIVAIALSGIIWRLFPRVAVTSEFPATGNNTEVKTTLPRIHNPLGHSSLPLNYNNGTNELYVRRPTQLPAVLDYRSPHESFLRQPPQLRFDRRLVLPSSKVKNPYAVRPR